MTQSFAKSIGVEVEYKVYDSTKSVVEALRNGEGDVAASGLTVNSKRKKEFDFGPVYQTTEEYLVCHRSIKQIKSRDDLKNIETEYQCRCRISGKNEKNGRRRRGAR